MSTTADLSSAMQIAGLHNLYCELLGMELVLHAYHERLWFDAIRDGLTEDMLRAVVLSRKKDVKAGKRFRNTLLLRNLIGSPDVVADLLNEAAMLEAQKRAFSPHQGRESVLKASGRRSEVPLSAPKSVRQLLESLKVQS